MAEHCFSNQSHLTDEASLKIHNFEVSRPFRLAKMTSCVECCHNSFGNGTWENEADK